MLEKINNLLQEVEGLALNTKDQVEEYRIKWLSKKGEITVLFDEFKTVTPELKKELGQKLNDLKKAAINNGNLFAALMETVKYCSLGQITHALYEVGGQYRRNM